MNIIVIGSGAWGTALAIHFAKFFSTYLYSRNDDFVEKLRKKRVNEKYLPNFIFPDNLQIKSLPIVFDTKDEDNLVIIASPIKSVRDILLTNKILIKTPILLACKGIEPDTGLFAHEIVKSIYPNNDKVGFLSGPSFAQELAKGLPCAICLASNNSIWIKDAVNKLNSNILRLYANDDIIGVAVGGAIKNVIAIAAGLVDGLNLGANARAAVITRGLAEVQRLAIALGAKSSTLMGLSGIGDLILTCTGDLSRNRNVGMKLAQGKDLDQILLELGHVAEGVGTVFEIVRLAKAVNVDMPIANLIYLILTKKVSLDSVYHYTMEREVKFE